MSYPTPEALKAQLTELGTTLLIEGGLCSRGADLLAPAMAEKAWHVVIQFDATNKRAFQVVQEAFTLLHEDPRMSLCDNDTLVECLFWGHVQVLMGTFPLKWAAFSHWGSTIPIPSA